MNEIAMLFGGSLILARIVIFIITIIAIVSVILIYMELKKISDYNERILNELYEIKDAVKPPVKQNYYYNNQR